MSKNATGLRLQKKVTEQTNTRQNCRMKKACLEKRPSNRLKRGKFPYKNACSVCASTPPVNTCSLFRMKLNSFWKSFTIKNAYVHKYEHASSASVYVTDCKVRSRSTYKVRHLSSGTHTPKVDQKKIYIRKWLRDEPLCRSLLTLIKYVGAKKIIGRGCQNRHTPLYIHCTCIPHMHQYD